MIQLLRSYLSRDLTLILRYFPWMLLLYVLLDIAEIFVLGATQDETFCSGRGMIQTNLTCSCFNGFRGPDCSLRPCPVGKAWVDFPSADNVAHAEGVECSNMGVCNRATGVCECRTGFGGQACDRRHLLVTNCPTKFATCGPLFLTKVLKAFYSEEGVQCPSNCTGHGKCLSMAEAASGWDGRLLVRPNVVYTSVWDADILHGCVCDPGWTGHDCSQLECPRGDDPLTTGQKNEVMRIVCRANSGSFVFSFRGATSAYIPFNSSYGYVEALLEDMDTVSDVDVSMMAGEGSSVCGQDEEATTLVEFLQDFGPLPAARVSPVDLTLYGDNASLHIETLFEIECPLCPSCAGGIYLIYDGDTTSSISSSATASDIQTALLALETLGSASVYGDLTSSLNVTMDGAGLTLCDSSSPMTTSISIRCSYGNLPSLQVVNSLRMVDAYDDGSGALVSLSLADLKGDKENEYCANHGSCDLSTGACQCDRNTTAFPDEWYWWESSDGYGRPGTRPDCGYQRVESTTNVSQGCPVGVVFANESSPTYSTMDKVVCSGKGTCNNSTGGCTCHPDFRGGDCSQRRCPTGKAWFDEAYADNAAHAYGAECGAMGNCNDDTGECVCREGWTGAACGRLACDDDCSGNGACLPMYRLAQLQENSRGEADPAVYGITDLVRPWGTSVYANPYTWDFDMVYGCLCDSGDRGGGSDSDNDGFYGGVHRPRVGTRGYVSGVYTDNSKLPGWDGYKCSQRTCPTGNNARKGAGKFEVQTVACTLSSGYFTLRFRGATTEAIDAGANASEVAAAVEHIPTIGSVSVSYTSGDTACNSFWADGEGIQITFLTELGNLPSVTTSPWFFVNSTTIGTKENLECAGNGVCDFDTGLCTCLDGWASSDGDGAAGDRGDCGYHYEFCTDKTHDVPTLDETFAQLLQQAAES